MSPRKTADLPPNRTRAATDTSRPDTRIASTIAPRSSSLGFDALSWDKTSPVREPTRFQNWRRRERRVSPDDGRQQRRLGIPNVSRSLGSSNINAERRMPSPTSVNSLPRRERTSAIASVRTPRTASESGLGVAAQWREVDIATPAQLLKQLSSASRRHPVSAVERHSNKSGLRPRVEFLSVHDPRKDCSRRRFRGVPLAEDGYEAWNDGTAPFRPCSSFKPSPKRRVVLRRPVQHQINPRLRLARRSNSRTSATLALLRNCDEGTARGTTCRSNSAPRSIAA